MSQPTNLFSLSYQGVRAQRPPNIIVKNFPPQPTFSQNVDIGDFWINFNPQNPSNAQIWVLLGLTGGIANWVLLEKSTGNVLTLTGNSGGAVPPLAGNINVVGDGVTVNVVGNPGTNTLTISAVGSGTVETITGNTGGAQSPIAGNFNIITANGTPKFAGTAATETLDFGLTNLILGDNAAFIAGATQNVGYGSGSLHNLTTGNDNTAIGYQSMFLNTIGSSNTMIGWESGGDLVSGNANTALGAVALTALATGSNNIAIGGSAGSSYVGAESSNIVIGNTGTAAESNTIRIGTQGGAAGQQNKVFLAGIAGVTVSNPSTVVVNTATGQLGVAAGGGQPIETITGDSGGPLSPTAGYFNFTGGTTGLTFAGAGSTETLTGVLVPANGGTGSNGASYTTDGVFYWDGTKFATTSAGVANQVLTSNGPGLAPTYQSMAAASTGLVLIQAQNITVAQAAVTFTSGITNTYRNLRLVYDNVNWNIGSATDPILVQLSTNGGVSYINTAYKNTQPAAVTSGLVVGMAGSLTMNATQFASGSVDIFNVTSGSGYIMTYDNPWMAYDTTGPLIIGLTNFTSSVYTVANTAVNAIQIVVANGESITGNFRLYGYT